MLIFWGAAIVLFLIVEAASVGLTSIWFAIGSLCALISAALGAPLWLQVVWFFIISIATLIATRPLAKKYVNSKSQPTNADRVIGQTVRVTEDIDNISETGAVLADGKVWTARSVSGGRIPAGSTVRVCDIQGVKLMVSAAEQE